MTTSYRSLTILFVSVLALVGYNFMSAAWTDAPANPPSNNVAAPINVSSTTQTKTGRLNLKGGPLLTTPTSTVLFRTNGNAMGNIFAAGAQMWSPEYCDGVGENCFEATDVGGNEEVGAARTQIPGWPDSIVCNTNGTNNAVIYYITLAPHADNGKVYYRNPVAGSSHIFNMDQTYYQFHPGVVNSNCSNKSIAALADDGLAFSFDVKTFSPEIAGLLINGGHDLSMKLQTAGVSGFQSAQVSAVYSGRAELEWVCNYFDPGSKPVWSSKRPYDSPGNNGIHYLDSTGSWKWAAASTRNSYILSVLCK